MVYQLLLINILKFKSLKYFISYPSKGYEINGWKKTGSKTAAISKLRTGTTLTKKTSYLKHFSFLFVLLIFFSCQKEEGETNQQNMKPNSDITVSARPTPSIFQKY